MEVPLGPETTGLRVVTTIRLQPIPTGVYHLLDPKTDPLLTVAVKNESHEPRPAPRPDEVLRRLGHAPRRAGPGPRSQGRREGARPSHLGIPGPARPGGDRHPGQGAPRHP